MGAIPLSPRSSEAIRRLVAEARASQTEWVRDLATSTATLPIYGDADGALLLTPEGDVLECLWDHSPHAVLDTRTILIALLRAASRYPALRELAPARPADGADCTACGGTGRLVIDGRVVDEILCGACSGKGWGGDVHIV